DAEILLRRQVRWVVQAAGGDLDGVAVQVVKGQRRAAGGAELPLGGGGTAEGGRLPAGPGEAFAADLRQRRERAADGLLAHAAVANGRLGPFEQRIADRAT